MINALHESAKFIIKAVVIVFIISGFFALVGLHLFNGLFHFRCFELETGLLLMNKYTCGYDTCPLKFQCIKFLVN